MSIAPADGSTESPLPTVVMPATKSSNATCRVAISVFMRAPVRAHVHAWVCMHALVQRVYVCVRVCLRMRVGGWVCARVGEGRLGVPADLARRMFIHRTPAALHGTRVYVLVCSTHHLRKCSLVGHTGAPQITSRAPVEHLGSGTLEYA